MKKIIIITLIITLSIPTLTKQTEHIHGKADINLIIEKKHIELELTIPAMSAIGFEYPPSKKEENVAISSVKKILNAPNIFTFYSTKGLFKKKSIIPLEEIEKSIKWHQDNDHEKHHDLNHNAHENHGKNINHQEDHHNEHQPSESAHSEFKLIGTYLNKSEDDISLITTTLFDSFEGIEEIMITILSNNEQKQIILHRKDAKIDL